MERFAYVSDEERRYLLLLVELCEQLRVTVDDLLDVAKYFLQLRSGKEIQPPERLKVIARE